MIRITKSGDEYKVEGLTQAELNTISLLLGNYDGDDHLRDIAEDFEEYPREDTGANINYITGNKADTLYNVFKRHRTIL